MKGSADPVALLVQPLPDRRTGRSFVEAILLAIFIYWGWDTVLSINEETEDSREDPGSRGPHQHACILLGTYVIVTVALLAFAGKGHSRPGQREATPTTSSDAIAEPLLGPWGAVILLI